MLLATEIGEDADVNLPVTESFFYDFLRKISNNNERLMYIYIFTALVVSTVVITLFRSFLFFAVSWRRLRSELFLGDFLLPFYT